MENRFENTQPEQQGWGTYNPPPNTSSGYTGTPLGLCASVREMLPALIEEDDEIRPETASAIFGHLTVCHFCAREYDEMRKVVLLVEALPPVELPMDFTGLIMRQIQAEPLPIQNEAPPRPTLAASSPVSGEAAVRPTINAEMPAETLTDRLGSRNTQTEETYRKESLSPSSVYAQSIAQAYRWERMALAGILSVVMACFLSAQWGREMLGVNVDGAAALMTQVQAVLSRVPGLSLLLGFVALALAQVGDILREAYENLGANAVQGVVIDAILIGIVYYVRSRRPPLRAGLRM